MKYAILFLIVVVSSCAKDRLTQYQEKFKEQAAIRDEMKAKAEKEIRKHLNHPNTYVYRDWMLLEQWKCPNKYMVDDAARMPSINSKDTFEYYYYYRKRDSLINEGFELTGYNGGLFYKAKNSYGVEDDGIFTVIYNSDREVKETY